MARDGVINSKGDEMKALEIKIRKGDAIDGIGITAEVESRIMDACIQFADEDPQEPEDMAFLTAKENFQIIIKNWRNRR